MPDRSPDEAPESHGVHAARRGDGAGVEEPEAPQPADGPDHEDWAERTETGGEATK